MKDNNQKDKITKTPVRLDKVDGVYKWKDVKLFIQGKEVQFTQLIYKNNK